MSKMHPDLKEYFRQFVPSRDPLLLELEEEAHREEIPIIGPVVGDLLHLLARVTQTRQILELGTATGYSAIYLARACETLDGRLVTLEMEQTLAARARTNFQRAGLEHRIDLIVGNALDEMSTMNGPFDLISLDIDKEFYLDVLTDCRRLLKKGGLFVVDNVGFEEADNFNRAIFNSPEWETVHLLSFLPLHSPEHDGLCLATRT